VNSPDFQSQMSLSRTGLTPVSISPPVFASVFKFPPAGLFQNPTIPVPKINRRRGCIELTPPIVNQCSAGELSGRAIFPAKTEKHRTGAHGKKGERGRFRNRRDVAELHKVDLSGSTNVSTTKWIHRKRLRSGAV